MPTAISRRAALVLALAAGLGAAPASADVSKLTLTAPAAPGGGWDQTARAMQAALQKAGIVPTVEVVNVAGAGGTIGLAQFAANAKGEPDQLLVSGLVMVGAILTNKSPVTLDAVTPLARITGEYEVIVVPKGSKYKTLKELLAALKADPGAVTWAGGSAGGTDHILAGLLAKEAGVDPKKINYIPFSGGGEALSALLANDVVAGVNGLAELEGQIKAGELTALAVSSPERLPGLDVPTLREAGVDLDFVNWRGVLAPGGISDEEKKELLSIIDRLVKSEPWKATLAERKWIDTYLAGEEFEKFLAADRARTESLLKEVGLVK